MNKHFEALERLAMPDDLHIKECKKLGISLTEDYEVVKLALLKAQEPKQYLKWRDLDFSNRTKVLKVRMNDTIYKIVYRVFDNTDEVQLLSEDEKLLYFNFVGKYKDNVQLFNDLRLEVLE